ncbi:MAG: hypothetical protein M3Y39_11390 [Chloroflexota bacterium]|nr:hypothetical protein [Chloroflexota bacterium]
MPSSIATAVETRMDSSKVGSADLARFAPLDVLDTLITDNGIPNESREALEQQHIQVMTTSAAVPAPELELTRNAPA